MNPLPAAAATTSSAPDLWFTLMKTVAMLSLVLGVLIGVLYLLKRVLNRRQGVGTAGIIRMVASFYLAPRQRVVLLEVAGEKVLIGVSAQHITWLSKIGAPVQPQDSTSEAPEGFLAALGKVNRKMFQGEKTSKWKTPDDDA